MYKLECNKENRECANIYFNKSLLYIDMNIDLAISLIVKLNHKFYFGKSKNSKTVHTNTTQLNSRIST